MILIGLPHAHQLFIFSLFCFTFVFCSGAVD